MPKLGTTLGCRCFSGSLAWGCSGRWARRYCWGSRRPKRSPFRRSASSSTAPSTAATFTSFTASLAAGVLVVVPVAVAVAVVAGRGARRESTAKNWLLVALPVMSTALAASQQRWRTHRGSSDWEKEEKEETTGLYLLRLTRTQLLHFVLLLLLLLLLRRSFHHRWQL